MICFKICLCYYEFNIILKILHKDIQVKIAIKRLYPAKKILAKIMQYAYSRTNIKFVTVYQIIMVHYVN